MSALKNRLVLVVASGLALGAIAVIALLQVNHSSDRNAELSLVEAEGTLNQLQIAPFGAVPPGEGDPVYARQENRFARQEIRGAREAIDETLAELSAGSPPSEIARAEPLLDANYGVIEQIYKLGTTVGYGAEADRLGQRGGRLSGEISSLFQKAEAEYHRRAERSRGLMLAGSAVVILGLLGAFGYFYARSSRLRRENERLLAASRQEALTDELTGLGNRKALLRDLESGIAAADHGRELVLALFDLDGFKLYNDSFGHPAGDRLLARLGGRLRDAVGSAGTAYRMGGDEFCVLAEIEAGGAEAVLRASDALVEGGDAFQIDASYGTVVIPSEASSASEALRVSDHRMYSNKTVRGSASRQSTDVLLKVLDERSDGLLEHVHDVARLAVLTGEVLGLDEMELQTLRVAAELHDIGKSAIPEAMLTKPGKLDDEEWEFMRQHTLIGERIVLAAPSLAPTGRLIRSSHERVDGTGYPDGLRGDEIPLGARVIAVCDAYDAMLAERPYAPAVSPADALAELERCAGSQFDREVVTAFKRAVNAESPATARLS